MSDQIINNLKELEQSAKQNTPLVEKRLSEAGLKPDEAFVLIAAQFHETLERLATDD